MKIGTESVKILKVIRTISTIGDGTKEDPVRPIYQYWDFKGNLLASHDTLDEAIDDSEELPPHKFLLLKPQEYQHIYKGGKYGRK